MGPTIEIDLAAIRDNTAYIVDLATKKGIDIWGVTKGAGGDRKVAQALLAGGVVGLADSRLQNLKQLADLPAELMLLRLPELSEVDEVVDLADISLNSELEVIKALNQAAKDQNRLHKVLLMVDIGDRREGVLPAEVVAMIRQVNRLNNIKLAGLGTNLGCFRGIVPDGEITDQFRAVVAKARARLGADFELISGGNSSSLSLLKRDGFRPISNCYRVGETILLGRTVPGGEQFVGTQTKTFLIKAEVIEVKTKQVAGRRQKRVILALGRQDISPEGLKLISKPGTIKGASSDHLVIEVDHKTKVELGEEIKFKLDYASLLRAMTSPYVKKVYKGDLSGR